MAGEWIKLEACTPEKAEVLTITAIMGWDDPDLTVGKLFRLWRWFDQHTTNGNAAGVTPALLDRIVGVTGFCDALSSVGWLCISSDVVTLPNFDRHNGNTAKNRALTAKRVAKHKTNAFGNDAGNAQSVSSALPKEEKRREEEITHTSAAKLPTCQASAVIDLYHEILPEMPSVKLETADRKRAIRKLWQWVLTSKKTNGERRAESAEDALQWVRSYFSRARENDFLMGRIARAGEHANWRCDLDFLLTDKGMKHVIEKTTEAA